MKEFLRKIKTYLEISHVIPLSRRYFLINSFDGAMVTLGIILGAYIAGVASPLAIISVGIATAFAMGLSGFFGAYLAEEAEREIMIRELEMEMLEKLKTTVIKRAHTFAVFWIAIIDSLAPIFATIISLSPIFLSLFGVIQIDTAMIAAVIVTFISLFSFGSWLGKISRKGVVKSGFKMLLAGIIAVLVLSFVKGFG